MTAAVRRCDSSRAGRRKPCVEVIWQLVMCDQRQAQHDALLNAAEEGPWVIYVAWVVLSRVLHTTQRCRIFLGSAIMWQVAAWQCDMTEGGQCQLAACQAQVGAWLSVGSVVPQRSESPFTHPPQFHML